MNTQLDARHFFPSVLQAIPTDNFEVYAYMNDGSVRRIDMRPSIRPGTVFEPLRDLITFKRLLTVMNGTVAWDVGGNRDETACVDIDPFAIMDEPPVSDPLEWDPDFTKLTKAEAISLQQAEEELARGETVSHDAINWDE